MTMTVVQALTREEMLDKQTNRGVWLDAYWATSDSESAGSALILQTTRRLICRLEINLPECSFSSHFRKVQFPAAHISIFSVFLGFLWQLIPLEFGTV